FGAPAIPGLSVAGGFKLMVEDKGGLGPDALQRQTDDLVRKLQAELGMTGVSTQFRSSTPQIFADIDRIKAYSLGVSQQDLSDTLPITMQSEWTEIMFMQCRAGDTALYVFALAVVCVFLALAALYESWSLPLAVILVVPLCLLCSVAGVLFTHNDVNIFVQIGLVVLVGLACKNAILIVEFARQTHQECKQR